MVVVVAIVVVVGMRARLAYVYAGASSSSTNRLLASGSHLFQLTLQLPLPLCLGILCGYIRAILYISRRVTRRIDLSQGIVFLFFIISFVRHIRRKSQTNAEGSKIMPTGAANLLNACICATETLSTFNLLILDFRHA